ncbi:MAG: hypothetical protein KJ060_05690, partial [Candidatus Hydrogenedentes bacterium]|nr:hypothetical protein [Candidatus Hydrogenedentota bacterium]
RNFAPNYSPLHVNVQKRAVCKQSLGTHADGSLRPFVPPIHHIRECPSWHFPRETCYIPLFPVSNTAQYSFVRPPAQRANPISNRAGADAIHQDTA